MPKKCELKKIMDEIHGKNYCLKRGDIYYHDINPEYFDTLDTETLDILIKTDDRILSLLETYPSGILYPDDKIVYEKETFISDIQRRLERLKFSYLKKDGTPLKKLNEALIVIKQIKTCDEFTKGSRFNLMLRKAFAILEDIVDSGDYISDYEKGTLKVALSDLERWVDESHKMRKTKISSISSKIS